MKACVSVNFCFNRTINWKIKADLFEMLCKCGQENLFNAWEDL